MATRTAEQALAKLRTFLEQLENAQIALADLVTEERRAHPGLTRYQAEDAVRSTYEGKYYDSKARAAHDAIQSYGAAASALLAERFGAGSQVTPVGGFGGGVKRAAGAPAPRDTNSAQERAAA